MSLWCSCGFFRCFWVVCSIFQGLNETNESVTSQLFFSHPSCRQHYHFFNAFYLLPGPGVLVELIPCSPGPAPPGSLQELYSNSVIHKHLIYLQHFPSCPCPNPGWGVTLPVLLLIAITSPSLLTSSGITGFKEKGLIILAGCSRRPLPSSNTAMGWFLSYFAFPLHINAVPLCSSLSTWPTFCFLEVLLCLRLGLLVSFLAAGLLLILFSNILWVPTWKDFWWLKTPWIYRWRYKIFKVFEI